MIERSFIWLFTRPLLFNLLGSALKIYYMRDENPAFKIWVSLLIRICKESFARKKPVVWCSAFVPTEIIYGFGGVPIHLEILASLMAYFKISGWFLEKANTKVSTDLCSFFRIALGMAMADCLPKPDLLLSSSILCDGSNKFFGYLSQRYNVPHLFMDVPYGNGKHGRQYLVEQLRDIIDSATDITGISWCPDRLRRVIDLSNQARKYLVRINTLRQARPAPFLGSEALSYGAGMLFCSLGEQLGVDFYRALFAFVKGNVDQGRGCVAGEKHRLLWLHHIRPYYPTNLFDILHRNRTVVAFEEGNHVYWPPLDQGAILASLAQKMLSNPSNGPLERRVENAIQLAKSYDADGAIHFSHWGCRQSCGGAAVLTDVLKESGIPCMILDGDGGDPALYSPGQTQTRLEAFIEMLDSK